MKPFALFWKYKFYVGLLFIVAAIIGTVAFLSRQASNREREAKKARRMQSNEILRR